MPLNEILASTYLKLFYEVIPNIVHSMRFYFNSPVTVVAGGESYFPDYTDATHVTGWKVSEIVLEVINRWYGDHTAIIPQLNILRVEMWKGQTGANDYLGNDGGSYAPYDEVGGDHIASAYHMYVFQTDDRLQYRVNFFDTKDAKPQRVAIPPPPDVDDGSLAWFMTRSAVTFCNQDGLPLASPVSHNTGYNRKLAKSYGKQLAP